jgi:hypothetical protein
MRLESVLLSLPRRARPLVLFVGICKRNKVYEDLAKALRAEGASRGFRRRAASFGSSPQDAFAF